MVILHICAVENKMSNGATVAALNHINEEAKSDGAHIMACHVKDEPLPWEDAVEVVAYADLGNVFTKVDLVVSAGKEFTKRKDTLCCCSPWRTDCRCTEPA